MQANTALCAPGDAGHVYFVEPDPSGSGSDSYDDSSSYTEPETPRSSRSMIQPNLSALRQVILPQETIQRIASLFPDAQGRNVMSLMGNENITINTDAREIGSEFMNHLQQTGESIMLTFPGVTASEPGIYVLGVTTEGITDGGTLIDSVSTITPAASASGVHSAADIEGITLLDQGGNPVTAKRATNGLTYSVVPDSQNMLVAVNLGAGESWRGSLTKPVQLPSVLVESVTVEQLADFAEQNDSRTQNETREQTVERITLNIINVIEEILARPKVIQNIIANNVLPPDILSRDITSADIRTFSDMDIVADPEEPTQAMMDAVRQDGYKIAAKLNTIQVHESGFYVFKVTLSEQSFAELEGVSVKDTRVYALNDSEVEIMPSFIMGLLNTFELLTMSGEKMDKIGVREFLLIGLLDSSQPLSLYLAKILLMLLLGGCGFGWGLPAVLSVLSAVMYGKFHTNRK